MGDKIKEWCLVIGIAIPIMIYTTVTSTYVFMCIWEWFISIPFGLETISFKTALCISLVVGYLTSNGWTHIPEEGLGSYFRHTFFSPIVTLVVCYLLQALYINA